MCRLPLALQDLLSQYVSSFNHKTQTLEGRNTDAFFLHSQYFSFSFTNNRIQDNQAPHTKHSLREFNIKESLRQSTQRFTGLPSEARSSHNSKKKKANARPFCGMYQQEAAQQGRGWEDTCWASHSRAGRASSAVQPQKIHLNSLTGRGGAQPGLGCLHSWNY